MGTFIYRLLMLVLALLALLAAASVIVLHNPTYLTYSINWLSKNYLSGDIEVSNATYEYPRELKLTGVQLGEDSKVSAITIWLSSSLPSATSPIQLDSILISDIDLSELKPLFKEKLRFFETHQVAVTNASYHSDGVQFNNANIQIKHPTWLENTIIPLGEIQLQTPSLKVNNLELSNVLLDADHLEKDSKVYGLSFEFNSSQISLQAEQLNGGDWEVFAATVNQLNVTPETLKTFETLNNTLPWRVASIKQIDLLHSSLKTQHLEVSDLSLSAKNVTLGLDNIWQQKNMSLSASAEGAIFAEKQWVNPTIKMNVSPERISLDDFSVELLDGYVSLSATATPTSLDINKLHAENIKYFIDSKNNLLSPSIMPFNHIYVENFELRNSQIIQLASKPYWQLSGINGDLTNANILNKNQWGLWSGSLELSANNISYGMLKGTQGILQMHTTQQTWSLDRLFIPLKKGYIAAKGAWNYSPNEQTWNMDLETDSLPLEDLTQYLNLPFSIDGLADVKMHSQGLSGNQNVFNQTLSGDMSIDIRNGTMMIPGESTIITQPFSVSDIHIAAKRGLLSINSNKLQGPGLGEKLAGDLDLASWRKGKLIFSLKSDKCGSTTLNLLDSKNQKIECNVDD
ncbi:AsmA family protein [Vibrio viridaestus]|uniref:AsmA family protein n=1 Tax=Vibrio viridaestus TaxID=2487322 RepID=A0A3N9TBC1_9VIBR|nr:AsmA family protein [Vibrio viridaestus]RQW61401.1 AsmA family protein [Vibrio viridaestus]